MIFGIKMDNFDPYNELLAIATLSHGNSYVFYEVAKPQWQVGLGVGLGVGHSYKFIRIGNS